MARTRREGATLRLLPGPGSLCLGLAVLAWACGPAGEDPSASETETAVVARFGEQEITAAEIDARILELPASERPVPGVDLEAWYEELIREMVVEAALLREAETRNLSEEPDFRRTREVAEKQIGLQFCLAELRPDLGEIAEEDLRAAYEERSESFEIPERRYVHHIFLRHDGEMSADDRRAEIEGLREQALRGESFPRLAEKHSDSESRHREGVLGWVTPGVLPPEFESVIFDLVEGVPSEPVATRDGLHLFYVDQVLPARTAGFGEFRHQLAQTLLAERRAAAVEDLTAEIEMPPGSFVLGREAFAELVAEGDPDALVLRIGDAELDLGDLRRALGQQRRLNAASRASAGGSVPEEAAWRALQELRRRELIHHHCRETGQIPADALEERLSKWREVALLDEQRRRRMVELAERDEERLRLFYRSNVGDFSGRPQWHVSLLEAPLGDDPAARMERLEEAARRQAPGLGDLAAELGGEVRDLGLVDLSALARRTSKLPALVTPLDEGELGPPVRIGDRLLMVEMVERREAEPAPFEEVRERVAVAYVEQYTREVYDELTEEILGSGSALKIDREAFASLGEAGLERSEVRVEDLEALLEEL